jgi:DNA mismatch endonuclease (patch repair protein)
VEYRGPKLERNQARDKKNLEALRDAGWEIFVIRECELKDGRDVGVRMIKFFDEITHDPVLRNQL